MLRAKEFSDRSAASGAIGAAFEKRGVLRVQAGLIAKFGVGSDIRSDETEIKETFERLGIPQAERESLAGVGAQYDSELVYHNVREEVAAQGVIYTDLESAMHGEYGDMIREHFMKLINPYFLVYIVNPVCLNQFFFSFPCIYTMLRE